MMKTPSERMLGVLLIIMAVVTVGQTAWYSWEQQKCNEAFAQHLVTRSQWMQEDRAALQNLIVAVFENDSDPAQFRAYRHWMQVTEENNRAREAHPLAELASCD